MNISPPPPPPPPIIELATALNGSISAGFLDKATGVKQDCLSPLAVSRSSPGAASANVSTHRQTPSDLLCNNTGNNFNEGTQVC